MISASSKKLKNLLQERNDVLRKLNPLCAGELFADLDPEFGAALSTADESELTVRSRNRGLRLLLDQWAQDCPALEKALLEDEVALMQQVAESGGDLCTRDRFGFSWTAYPVRVHGRISGCLFGGRGRLLGGDQAKELAALTGLPLDRLTLELNAACPAVAEGEDSDAGLRARREVMERAMDAHLRVHELSQRLEASENDRSAGALLPGVVHRFNSLLSVVLGYSSHLLNHEDLNAEVATALRKIADSAQRGRSLTEDLLAFTAVSGKDKTTCSMHGLIENVSALLPGRVGDSVQWLMRLNSENDAVDAAPGDLHRLVYLLLSSAAGGVDGTGVVEVETKCVKLASGTECIKITAVPAARSGDPQASGSRFTALYTAAARVGGTLTLMPQVAGWPQVDLILPLVAKPPEFEELEPAGQLQSSQIWVVDDDPIFREMCGVVLEQEGHEVLELEGGVDFQTRWNQASVRPDLVICDFSMPDLNGVELCNWMKEQESEVPIILVSGLTGDQPDVREVLQRKGIYFLQKPFSYGELSAMAAVATGEQLLEDTLPV